MYQGKELSETLAAGILHSFIKASLTTAKLSLVSMYFDLLPKQA